MLLGEGGSGSGRVAVADTETRCWHAPAAVHSRLAVFLQCQHMNKPSPGVFHCVRSHTVSCYSNDVPSQRRDFGAIAARTNYTTKKASVAAEKLYTKKPSSSTARPKGSTSAQQSHGILQAGQHTT